MSAQSLWILENRHMGEGTWFELLRVSCASFEIRFVYKSHVFS